MDPAAVIPPPVPDTENAALLYNAAILILKATPWQPDPATPVEPLIRMGDSKMTWWRVERVPPHAPAEWAGALREPVMTTVVSLVAMGNSKPACRFDLNARPGATGASYDGIGLLCLGRVLAAKALVEADDDHPQDAWRTILADLQLARGSQEAPSLMSPMIAGAVASIALGVAAWLQSQASPDPATTVALAEALDALAVKESLAACIDAERLLFFERVFAHEEGLSPLRSESGMGWPRRAVVWLGNELYASPLALPLWQWDHACCLRVMGEAAAAMALPYDRASKELLDGLRGSVPRYCLVSQLCTGPGLGSRKARFVSDLARVRLARIALALLATRPDDGSFPPDLSGVAAAGIDTTDPFAGQPLVYRRTEGGFILYSLGPDQHDDGGTPRPRGSPEQAQSEQGWDLVWAYPPAPRAD
jgi:hypothetical protein